MFITGKQGGMKPLQYYWYRPNHFVWLLLPLSWVFCFVSILRRKLYLSDIIRSYGCQVPVVVVGNIVVGGSGKTPLLISLCEYVKSHGLRPGVVSRGYGGSFKGVKQLDNGDTADLVGDEPLMIFQRTGVPVVVSADRVAAVSALLENNDCDVVFSDDGLQHYRMKRDFEIAVVDANRRYGNGYCLPAGPLRERVSRLEDVDMVIYNGRTTVSAEPFFYELQFASLSRLDGSEQGLISSLAGQSIHAVAGIGHPERFFGQLSKNGINVIEHAFPDHHIYKQQDFSGWENEIILMTEKDAVKCRHLSLGNAWVVTVNAIFSDALEKRLTSVLLPLVKR